MAGRPRNFDVDEAIKKAGDLFWRKGYEATSTEDLLAAMGIGKGSFYLHFKKGKKELFQATLKAFAENSLQQLKMELAHSSNKLQVIKDRYFRRLADKSYIDKGCYIGNTLVEMANYDDEMKDLAAQYLHKLEGMFLNALEVAKQNGQLNASSDPIFLAKYLINLWNGMNVTRRMGGDEKVLLRVIEKNLEILQ